MTETACGGSDFRLDPHNECLLRGSEEYPLRPKTYAVLLRLVSHPGQLVTKSQLLDSVWTDSYVSDMVLKVSIRELRKAFEDDARAPRYIQTLHGRGYRFIGRLDVAEPPPRGRPGSPTGIFCGRQAELDRLRSCLAKALDGERQVVFVTGPDGIGKTALVEAFSHRPAPETRRSTSLAVNARNSMAGSRPVCLFWRAWNASAAKPDGNGSSRGSAGTLRVGWRRCLR